MSRFHRFASSAPPRELVPPTAFEVTGTPLLLTDWQQWGPANTAIGIWVSNTGGGTLTVTPELSPDGVHVCTGSYAPKAWDVEANAAGLDQYGIDFGLAPYVRLWVTGTSTGIWLVNALPRY